MSVTRLPNPAISYAKTQKGVTSVPVQRDTSFRRMGEAAKILMSVQRNNIIVNSFVLTPLEALHVNVHLGLPNIIQPVSITTNVPLKSIFVELKVYVRTLLEASLVNVRGVSH